MTSSLLPHSPNSQACKPVPSLLGRARILPSGSGDPPFSIWLSSKAQSEKATSSKQPSHLSRVNKQVFLWVPTHPEPSRTAFFVSQEWADSTCRFLSLQTRAAHLRRMQRCQNSRFLWKAFQIFNIWQLTEMVYVVFKMVLTGREFLRWNLYF